MMLPIHRQLGVAIKRLRMNAGWSQVALAERSGLHRTTLSEIERGVSNLSVDLAQQIARALGMTLSALCAEAELSRRGPRR